MKKTLKIFSKYDKKISKDLWLGDPGLHLCSMEVLDACFCQGRRLAGHI
jgi:hypothetical protein